jgi:ATP-dependent helicase HrpB
VASPGRLPVGDLPIAEAIEPLRAALADRGRAVLHAPPGAGKTTIVPLVLLDEPWCDGTVLVLEPRRLAVRNATRRLAQLLGEQPGERVGWRMRQDTRVSGRTRIEVITEGVLTRRLQRDPELAGVSAVVFDEFHERSLDADLGLALTLEVVDALRPELRIVVMSATLDIEPVAALLDAPVVRSEGRAFPVEIVHVDPPSGRGDRRRAAEAAVAPTVRRALAAHDGDVLVFLPGGAEIRRAERALGDPGADVDVRPLHGSMPPAAQDAAIAPSPPGRRKVVLSTAIAETSLTIEGVTVVVDAGLRRTPRLDPGSGMSRLVTLPVTLAEAEQRAGRAGRLSPGTAYRLWSRAEDATRRSHPEPEIEVADLTPLALELAAWGASEDDLAWLTPPPPAHLAAARQLLQRLGALDGDGGATSHGRAMAELALHPRLAHVLLGGAALGHGALAADLAASLHEHGLSRRRSTDVADRVRALRSPGDHDRGAVERARRDARRWREVVGAAGRPGDTVGTGEDDALGLVLALGFPDRIGRARPPRADGSGRGELLLANGRGAFLDPTDPLAASAWVVVAELDGQATRSRVYEAAALDESDVRTAAGDAITVETEVGWDDRAGDVVARTVERLGAITLAERPVDDAPPEALAAALLDGIRREGASLLPWDDEARRLQDRLAFLHRLDPARWPDVGDDALVAGADERIGPMLVGMRRVRDLRRLDLREVLQAGLGWQDRSAIDDLAPERLAVPSGNRHRVDYSVDPPVLAVKLQEVFGATETPTVGGGRVPVVLHLLSPAGRPLQVTQDLASFWRGAYAEVRADMRGRYPKHPWPEDPSTAVPTARTKRR